MPETTSANLRAPRGSFMAWAAACTALAMGLSAMGVQAQPRDQRHDQRHGQRHDQRHEQRKGPRYEQQHRPGYAQPRPPQMRPNPGPPPQAYGQRHWRGAGPDHRWHRGDRLPPMYRSRHYVVDDWRVHRLSPPPRGYHWVQYGGDYLLVAIATGVIVQLILSQ